MVEVIDQLWIILYEQVNWTLCKDIRSANMCPSIVAQRGVRNELDYKGSDEAKVRDQCVL